MNISLPDPMKQYVDDQVTGGGYSSASEYMRELVRTNQKHKAKEHLEEILLAAMQSEAMELTPEMWEELRRNLRSKAAARIPAQS